MIRKVKGADFASSSSPDEIRRALRHRLSPTGSGHSLFCVCSPGSFSCSGLCRTAPLGWRPLPAVSAELRSLLGTGEATRIGAFFWLKEPARVR